MPDDLLPPELPSITLTLSALAERLGANLVGDPELVVRGVAGIDEAGPDDLTFVANPKYAAKARTTQAAAVLVEPEFQVIDAATLRVDNPYLAFARAIEMFYTGPEYAPGVHPTAVIADTARIGPRAHIGAYVVIADHVVIGEDAVILPHVVLYAHVRVGDRFFAHAHAVVRELCHLGDDVTLQNGAIVGADGFGFARQHGKEFAGRAWYKIRQSGMAVLEDAVEVQANACIDRASIGQTRVGSGSKIDNLVQVGHGSTIGKDTLLCAQVGLAGSTKVGNNVILAGQVGVAGHCSVGDGAIATAQSGIPGDVAAGAVVSGYPATDNRQWLRSVALFNRLPEVLKQIRKKE